MLPCIICNCYRNKARLSGKEKAAIAGRLFSAAKVEFRY